MLNIFVSVQFSENAQYLALLAAEIAHLNKARLILFHAYQDDEAITSQLEEEQYNERWVQTQLDKLARKLHKATNVSITRLVKPGTSATEIIAVAKLIKADVVILQDEAAKGISGTTLTYHEALPIISAFTGADKPSLRTSLQDQFKMLGFTSPTALLQAV
ncbi:universal stress protein [uncultured Pontibacter sp.]|uniref:universal stress protein n=1 Tax=uncultured Pontibacter sp. TaxID=453356 RepID=UPI002615DD4C|nr:universal stress protein [uncultured Pontibacter sp.]